LAQTGSQEPIIQTDQFAEHFAITVLPLTSILVDAPLLRIAVQSDAANEL
jgi:mRNA interferase MazF